MTVESPAGTPQKGTPRLRFALLIAVFALAGILAGVGAYTFAYAKGGSYLLDDPQACVNCHVMREHLDGWQQSAHHAHAVCNDCHLPQGRRDL